MRWSIFAAAVVISACGRHGTEITVSAAASLQNAMQELAHVYEQQHPDTRVTLNFGSSGMLAQQIEQGAPADVFFSAAPKPMDELASKGLILSGTRHDLLRNEIVLIVPQSGAAPSSFQDLVKARLIALGDPQSVPAGDYGRQVLTALGLWDAVRPKLVLAKDVRQVLSYVETGNADAGIVYATDARESGKVRVAAIAPQNSHAPVVYPVAVLRESRAPAAARSFVEFLAGEQARAVFEQYGFTAVPR
jgi:molybdate transport system substrate-binding protein